MERAKAQKELLKRIVKLINGLKEDQESREILDGKGWEKGFDVIIQILEDWHLNIEDGKEEESEKYEINLADRERLFEIREMTYNLFMDSKKALTKQNQLLWDIKFRLDGEKYGK